jgi:hypothetical protein
MAKGTTQLGFVNPNGQTVIRRTDIPGTDHLQYTYVMRCTHCNHQYGVNGSDTHHRRCPNCQDGAPGLPL